jgi:hypothetical protein
MVRTSEAIQPFRARFPNLILHTLTTVMKENQDEILEIYKEVKQRFQPDGLSFNYCRGNPLDPRQIEVDQEKYEQLKQRLESDFSEGRLQREPSAYTTANHILDQQVRASVEGAVLLRCGTSRRCDLQRRRRGRVRDEEQQARQSAERELRFPQAMVQRQSPASRARGSPGMFLHSRVWPLFLDDLSRLPGKRPRQRG